MDCPSAARARARTTTCRRSRTRLTALLVASQLAACAPAVKPDAAARRAPHPRPTADAAPGAVARDTAAAPAPAAEPAAAAIGEAVAPRAPAEHARQAPASSALPRGRSARAVDELLDGALAPSRPPSPAASGPRKRARSPGALHGAGRAAVGHGAGGLAITGRHEAYGVAQQPLAALPLPQSEPWNTEGYAHRSDNPFVAVADSPLSTFSIDVDTASYSNVRRFLRDGGLPPPDAVRVEEMINYFRYAYPAPSGGEPFSVHAEVASAPWSPRHRLVHIGLRAREIAQAAVPARNLVFLIDVSGSMQSADKLPLLQRGLSMLARDLRPQDRIAIVVYAGSSGLVLPSTSGRDQARILAALEALQAGGSTNGGGGIELAYRVAQDNFIRGGINRVLLATDGDFNVGVTSHGDLTRLIEKRRESGVFLTVLGFGTGNLKDSTMELLADKGNGNYAYIDSIDEAHKVLVREAGSTLVTVAKDVKLQIEWNPELVASYRLIGYENRLLADRDFNDDRKDAGEVGAGHTVTALYEVELAAEAARKPRDVDALRYQSERSPTAAAASGELLTLKVRYKRPDQQRSALLRHAVADAGTSVEQSSQDFRWAAAVAGFGMLLRGSPARGNLSIALVQSLARSALGPDESGDRRELLRLTELAAALGAGGSTGAIASGR